MGGPKQERSRGHRCLAHDTHGAAGGGPTIDTQAFCDLAQPEVFLEKGNGFQSPLLEGLGISEGSHVSLPNRRMRH